MTKIYISGPITGIPDNNNQNFSKAEQLLKSLGWETVNPCTFSCSLDNNHPDYYTTMLKICLKALLECENIYMLGGWMDSTGARLEHLIAERLNYRRFYLGSQPTPEMACQ